MFRCTYTIIITRFVLAQLGRVDNVNRAVVFIRGLDGDVLAVDSHDVDVALFIAVQDCVLWLDGVLRYVHNTLRRVLQWLYGNSSLTTTSPVIFLPG